MMEVKGLYPREEIRRKNWLGVALGDQFFRVLKIRFPLEETECGPSLGMVGSEQKPFDEKGVRR